MGAGDGKLFAAAAAWFHPAALIALGFLIALSGVALSLAVLGGRYLRPGAVGEGRLGNAMKIAVPYGVAIMAGTILAAEIHSGSS